MVIPKWQNWAKADPKSNIFSKQSPNMYIHQVWSRLNDSFPKLLQKTTNFGHLDQHGSELNHHWRFTQIVCTPDLKLIGRLSLIMAGNHQFQPFWYFLADRRTENGLTRPKINIVCRVEIIIITEGIKSICLMILIKFPCKIIIS